MAKLAYLIPNRRTAPAWSAALEPADLEMEPVVTLPLLGTIPAGLPIEAIEDRESVQVPLHMARKASYALRVRGHSMTEDHIQDGDIVLVEQRQTAENGDTVIAKLNDDQVTLKRFYSEAGGIRLQPAHPDLLPMYVRHDAIDILGIVTGVIRLAP